MNVGTGVWANNADETDAGERELVQQARTDKQAVRVLYQRYNTRVYRYVLARVGNANDAADLTQQVFVKMLQGLPAYQERGVPFAAWLFRIARNTVASAGRKSKPGASLDEPLFTEALSDQTSMERDVLHAEDLQRLQRALYRLDEPQRELLALRFAAGLTAREIASLVGKNQDAVKKQLSRTLKTLKEHYDAI